MVSFSMGKRLGMTKSSKLSNLDPSALVFGPVVEEWTKLPRIWSIPDRFHEVWMAGLSMQWPHGLPRCTSLGLEVLRKKENNGIHMDPP